jgi:peptidoglycan/xylan/chitin deacetylase (PgdA/CDA1 family)
LADVAARISDSLRPGGHFLTAHANVVADEPDETGFAWDVPYGAATISRVFGQVSGLRLLREIKTPLYRIQLYQKVDRASAPVPQPEVSLEPNRVQPDPSIARWIRRETGGGHQPRTTRDAVTHRLPILMYHQVAEGGAPARARWRVTPSRFEDQLRYLREAGFYSVGLSTWRSAMGHRRPLPGRAVMITFDDGFLDFGSQAWPLLREYGFSAVLFVVSERVGQSNDWDPPVSAGDRLLDWEQLRRLCRDGLEIGSHSATHPRLRSLPVEDVAREAAKSRATLQRELGQPVTAFAYPFGDHDPAIRHLVGACGYDQGFGCFPADRASLNGDLMNQPRIEVLGDHDMTQFIAGLEDR